MECTSQPMTEIGEVSSVPSGENLQSSFQSCCWMWMHSSSRDFCDGINRYWHATPTNLMWSICLGGQESPVLNLTS